MSLLLWIAVILGVIVLLLLSPLIWFMIAGVAEAEGIEVHIGAPSRVAASSEFDLVVNITNTLDRPRTLRSLDFENELLKGFAIHTIAPEPADRSSMLGTTAYHFAKHPIAAAGSLALKLRCVALQPGSYSGGIEIYIDKANSRSYQTAFAITVT